MPIDEFSVTSVPILMTSGENLQSHGSAFFYKRNADIYLITNWHNLSGRNPITGAPLSNTGALPHTAAIPFHLEQLGTWSNPYNFPLFSDTGEILWKQHPQHGQNVDIAMLKITVPPNCKVYPINEIASADTMRIEVGMDVFVLGFPMRFFTGIFPIWKRATLATEYDFAVEGLPKFLIDTATQKGMSGSPVILRQRGGYSDVNGNMMMGMSSATKFLGISSGRYEGDDLAAVQLGIVWRKEIIDEIIDSGVPGDYILRAA
jgi:hypothetical protein